MLKYKIPQIVTLTLFDLNKVSSLGYLDSNQE